YSLTDGPRVVALLDAAMRLEQLDDGQVGCRFPVGDPSAFEHEPAVRTMRPREFPEEARLAQACLANYGDGLAMSGSSALDHVRQLLNLTVPPDEAGQAARGAGLKA